MNCEGLCEALREKIAEQVESTERLLARVPAERLEWRPAHSAWTVAEVAAHLVESVAGFCAALYAVEPERLAHFAALRPLAGVRSCSPGEALERIAIFRKHVDEGFAALSDTALARRIPTVFVPAGETVLTLLLGNLEHLVNHKHQFFVCLKEAGVAVGTPDLYRLRGAAGA